MNASDWLPMMFMCLMGLSILVYAILDGYDLGVGILLPMNKSAQQQRDTMVASIGPFWDANETWLVLAVGILLVAFPQAYNLVLRELYIPATVMLIGLILRGVAFDFRTKSIDHHRRLWDGIFQAGSVMTGLAQGYMLGRYVLGFEDGAAAQFFAWISAFCVTAAYAFIGGAWLVMKTEAGLQFRMARRARRSAWFAAAGIALVSLVNPLVSDRVFERWLAFPEILILFPIPLVCAGLFVVVDRYLKHVPHRDDFGCWVPFACAVIIFFMSFQGLAYSFYPYVVPGQLSILDAASATESLHIIFYGVLLVVPMILLYTVFAYRVFWGKATSLRYY